MTELINMELKGLNLGQEITSDSADNVAVTKKYVDDLIRDEIIGGDATESDLGTLGNLVGTNLADIGNLADPQEQAGTLVGGLTQMTTVRQNNMATLEADRASEINLFTSDINQQLFSAEKVLCDHGGWVIDQQNTTINDLLEPITQEHASQQTNLTTLFNQRRADVGYKKIICGAGKGMDAIETIYQHPTTSQRPPANAFNNRLDTWGTPGEMQGYFSEKNTQHKSLTVEFTDPTVCTEMHFWSNPEHWGSVSENGVVGEDYSAIHETPKEMAIYGSNTRDSTDTPQNIVDGRYDFLAEFDNTADSFPYNKHVTNGFVSDNLNLATVFKLNNTTPYKYYTILVKSIIRVNTEFDYSETEGAYEWCWSASEIAFVGDEISDSTVRTEVSDSIQDRETAVENHISNHKVVLDVVDQSVDNLKNERVENLHKSISFLGADTNLENFTNNSGAGAGVAPGPDTTVFPGSDLTHAFDGTTGQYPQCIVLTPPPSSLFATLDINCGQGLQRELGRVAMWSRTDAKNENPAVVIIKGRNDENSEFTTLYSNEDKPFVMEDYPNTSETTVTVPVPVPVPVSDLTADKSLDLMIENPAPYQYYQIQMKGMGIDDNWRVGIGELGLYERSVHDDVVAERYFRNEATAVLETNINNLKAAADSDFAQIDSNIDTTVQVRKNALADITTDIGDLSDARDVLMQEKSDDINDMVTSRISDMTNVTNNLSTAIQSRKSEVTSLEASRTVAITNVDSILTGKTDELDNKLQQINEDFTGNFNQNSANIAVLNTDRVSPDGSFLPLGVEIAEVEAQRKQVLTTASSRLDQSSATVQGELDNFNNNKLDKSDNFSGGESQNFKIGEDAYLYIGKHWRIAANNNINTANRKLEFEYSPDSINWILGAPLFNF